MRITHAALLTIVATLALGLTAAADVTLNGMFTDNMVLQRDIAVPVFGKADPGEQVTVTIGDQTRTSIAGDDGKWMVTFAPLAMEGAFEVAVGDEITLTNVVLGDVWICSGQSNMAMTVGRSLNAAEEIAAADLPNVRLYTFPRKISPEPLDEVAGSWVPCSPEVVGRFSGTGFFFGRHLHQELGVPIGLVNTSWGGTPAEAWTSDEKLRANPLFQSIFDMWARILEAYPEAFEKYENETLPRWLEMRGLSRIAGRPPSRKPRAPMDETSARYPACLFNGMIHPIIPMAIKGAIWYQGEANAGRAWEYRTLLPALIEDWRERWGQGDFPFGIVQLANYRAVQDGPEASAWAELREAQTLTAFNDRNNGLAVIIDAGEAADIHPRNKQAAGIRMALWALGEVYDQDIVYYGPVYRSMEIVHTSVVLRFDHVGSGLCRRVTENAPYASELVGFEVAGWDRVWHTAEATYEGDTVVVNSSEVSRPVAARYGWAYNPVCNLYNREGLPANPFRTDNWRRVTQPR